MNLSITFSILYFNTLIKYATYYFAPISGNKTNFNKYGCHIYLKQCLTIEHEKLTCTCILQYILQCIWPSASIDDQVFYKLTELIK